MTGGTWFARYYAHRVDVRPTRWSLQLEGYLPSGGLQPP